MNAELLLISTRLLLSFLIPFPAVIHSRNTAKTNIYNRNALPKQLPRSGCEGLWIRPLNQTISPPQQRCHCTDSDVSCINLQMRPPPPGEKADVFLQFDEKIFKNVKSLTIHGNNLERLPRRLFGSGDAHHSLKYLNLSSNYFIHLYPDSFDQDLDQLEVLDLSDNEIILPDRKDTGLLRHIPSLKKLYLRNSFISTTADHTEKQVKRLARTLKLSKLVNLEELDLERNNFREIPKYLGCYLPSLKVLSYRYNPVQSWDIVVNGSCFSKLEVLDLTGIRTKHFDQQFIQFASSLNSKTQIRMFCQVSCTSRLTDFISWLNSTSKVVDKQNITCGSAQPKRFVGAFVMALNVDELTYSNTTGLAIETISKPAASLSVLSVCFLFCISHIL